MRLYSIWCNDRQRFYRGVQYFKHYWSESPFLWRSAQGAKNGLIKCASEFRGRHYSKAIWTYDDQPLVCAKQDDEFLIGDLRFSNFQKTLLASVDLIVTEVKVLGEERLSAIEVIESDNFLPQQLKALACSNLDHSQKNQFSCEVT